MIASHAHRFVFMKTLKTAGTSVEIALSRVCGPDDVITPLPEEDEVIRAREGGRGPQNNESPPQPRRLHEHVRASRVRATLGKDVWDDYFTFAIERNPWDAVVSLYFWMRRNDKVGSFDEFLTMPNIGQLSERNYRIYHVGGEVGVDRVLRYENLADELDRVWRELDLPGRPELPRAKGGARPAGSHYRDLLDNAARDHVAEVFAWQLAETGYEF